MWATCKNLPCAMILTNSIIFVRLIQHSFQMRHAGLFWLVNIRFLAVAWKLFCVGVLKRSMYFSNSTYDFEYLHEIDFADDKEVKGGKSSIQSRINKMNETSKERFNKRSCLYMTIDQIQKENLAMVYFILVNMINC